MVEPKMSDALCRSCRNPSSTILSTIILNGAKYPLRSRTPQGFAWMPSCVHVHCSRISSNVPAPPGSARNASARSDIFFFRSCIEATTWISFKPLWSNSLSTSTTLNNPDDGSSQPDRLVGHDPHQPVLCAAIDDSMALGHEHTRRRVSAPQTPFVSPPPRRNRCRR